MQPRMGCRLLLAHAPPSEVIRAVAEKIQGRPPFQRTFNENVSCDSFDTRRSRTGEAARVTWQRSSTLRVGSAWSLLCRPCPRRDGTV
jgi:hypothetical protein